jgi:chromosome segregation ATPase
MRQLNALIAKGEESLKRAYAEIDDHRAAALKLREANNKLRQALAIREKEAGDREHEIRQLKKANNALSAANDKLNEILGDQEQVNQKLSLDVAMLKDQVGKLRAQQGLEP